MDFSTVFKHLFKLLKSKPIDFFVASGLVVVLALVELPLPLFMAILIDNIIPTNNTSALWVVGIFLFTIRSSASIFQVFQNYIVSNMSNHFTSDLRKTMFTKMLRLPFSKYLNDDANGMITRFMEDVNTVQEFIAQTVQFFIRPFLSAFFLIAVMLIWNPILALYCILIVPAVVITTRSIRTRMKQYSRERRYTTEKFEVAAGEAFSNIRIIRAFNAEDKFCADIEKHIHKIEDSSISFTIWNQLANGTIQAINSLNSVGFIFFAAHQVFQGNLTIGGFIALHTMSQGIRGPINQIMFYLTSLKSKTIGFERAFEVTQEIAEQDYKQNPQELKTYNGQITFENVTLEYDESVKVIDNLSFTIEPGEMVALVGPSGAGKSSIANLIMGLYKASSGKVLADNHNMEFLDIYSFRSQMGVVFQDPILFNNSVRFNLKIAKLTASDEEIWSALELANAKTFVKGLPQQLDTIIGVNGIKLSGGQKQRLSIARAILTNPKLMILDEATSSLDSSSELEIQKSLENALKGRSSLVIAHRLSTILQADKIIVMEKGKISEMGTHAELIAKKKGLYYKLYETQTNGYFD